MSGRATHNDALTKVVLGIPDEFKTPSNCLAIASRLFVAMQDPVVDAERDVVSEVVEGSSLVLGFAERRLVRLRADDVLEIGVDVAVRRSQPGRARRETKGTHGSSVRTMTLTAG